MGELATKMRSLEFEPSVPVTGPAPLTMVASTEIRKTVGWQELADFVELAEAIETPADVSPHEWSLRKNALRVALGRL